MRGGIGSEAGVLALRGEPWSQGGCGARMAVMYMEPPRGLSGCSPGLVRRHRGWWEPWSEQVVNVTLAHRDGEGGPARCLRGIGGRKMLDMRVEPASPSCVFSQDYDCTDSLQRVASQRADEVDGS